VTKFNRDRGFGFIQPNDGSDDIFVHFSAIISPPDCKILEEDMEVSFNVDEGPKAINVKIIGN
jgi:CspA family cold shock protein